MMCYKDRMWCSESPSCANETCSRNFNAEEKAKAEAWWGKPGAPVNFGNLAGPTCGYIAKDRLPKKPSELIELAVKCVRECMADPAYDIDHRYYHIPTMDYEDPESHFNLTEESLDRIAEGGEVTVVGLAGAVMAKALGVDPWKDLHRGVIWHGISMDDQRMLHCLGDLPRGNVPDCILRMGVPREQEREEELTWSWDLPKENEPLLAALGMLICSLKESGL